MINGLDRMMPIRYARRTVRNRRLPILTSGPFLAMIGPGSPTSTSAGIAIVLTGLITARLLFRRASVEGTTLVAPWCWTIGAVVAIGVTHGLLPLFHGPWLETTIGTLQFSATMLTFCPAVAVLGAKRPHDRTWQFVVAALWLVLVVSGTAHSLAPGSPVLGDRHASPVDPVWAGFLWLLITVTFLNWLPTRHALPALLAISGQICLATPFLPGMPSLPAAWVAPTGLATFGLSLLLIRRAGDHCSRRPMPLRESLDIMWVEFRNMYGALWGLRVMQRVNLFLASQSVVEQYGWWGLDSDADPTESVPSSSPARSRTATDSHREAEQRGTPDAGSPLDANVKLPQVWQNLLRRFVSPQWIASYLDQSLD